MTAIIFSPLGENKIEREGGGGKKQSEIKIKKGTKKAVQMRWSLRRSLITHVIFFFSFPPFFLTSLFLFLFFSFFFFAISHFSPATSFTLREEEKKYDLRYPDGPKRYRRSYAIGSRRYLLSRCASIQKIIPSALIYIF